MAQIVSRRGSGHGRNHGPATHNATSSPYSRDTAQGRAVKRPRTEGLGSRQRYEGNPRRSTT
jgi:hypothetical protein